MSAQVSSIDVRLTFLTTLALVQGLVFNEVDGDSVHFTDPAPMGVFAAFFGAVFFDVNGLLLTGILFSLYYASFPQRQVVITPHVILFSVCVATSLTQIVIAVHPLAQDASHRRSAGLYVAHKLCIHRACGAALRGHRHPRALLAFSVLHESRQHVPIEMVSVVRASGV